MRTYGMHMVISEFSTTLPEVARAASKKKYLYQRHTM
jgi:hypothetical protein